MKAIDGMEVWVAMVGDGCGDETVVGVFLTEQEADAAAKKSIQGWLDLDSRRDIRLAHAGGECFTVGETLMLKAPSKR